MIKQNIISFLFLTLVLTIGNSQNSKNKFDNNGKRHGYWSKNFHNTDQKRYEGQFLHGKEIDTFNYYKLSQGKSVLSATKVFNVKNNFAEVKFFSSKGNIISEGIMDGKLYINKWLFYHNNSSQIMIIENRNDKGLLNGKYEIYFLNGKIAETKNYINNKLEGVSKLYSDKGILLRSSNYSNNLLNGFTKYFNVEGILTSEGFYKDDRKIDVWKYYKNGKLVKELNHTTKEIKKY